MSTSPETPLGYGLIGCGAFGMFCLERYRRMDELRCVALADADAKTAERAAKIFGIHACKTPDELLAREDVDIVHIATPPSTHCELVMQALDAGKHVLCEKPPALKIDDAREMLDAAQRAGRLLAVNLIMRYNPLCEKVKTLVAEKLLGEPLHGFFENYAKDEDLPPDHWFWEPGKSGGIFIEHSVHFFDLFTWWLGEGRIVSAEATRRPGTDFVEQVSCAAIHGESVIVNLYHGFHQATRMDRQELRLLFERGSLSLFDWVPTRIQIDALVDEGTLARLEEVFPGARVETVETYAGDGRHLTSRHKSCEVDRRVRIDADVGMTKPALYQHVLGELMADQVRAIHDPKHVRRVTGLNGLTSLVFAVEADRLSSEG